MNALETALYGELTGDTALMELVDGVYAYMTPENAPLPVIVFYSQSEISQYVLAERAWIDCLYGVKAITEGGSMSDANAIDEAIDDTIGDTELTVDSEVTLLCPPRESSSHLTPRLPTA